ncbi:MAG: VCBS repeat-containing protein [Burkholderiales bacterium]|nr:VCBS repeat-containing protein [Burkholderiales bacterium]
MATLTGFYTPFFELVPLTGKAKWVSALSTADFNGDGHEDLLVLGAFYPGPDTQYTGQPGVLLPGDGEGFASAPASMFPWQTLQTVHPRKVLIEDFNGDDKPDVFVASHGWDTAPFPGEQNRLILSTPTGWADATAALPQLSDFTHTAAAADIDADGDLDIFVGNGYAGQNGILSYMLMNDGTGQFTMTRANLPAGTNEVLDFNAPNHFPGANFMDLNGDGLPELVITADAGAVYDKLRNNVVLWNQGGSFDNAHKTELPATAFFSNQIVLDAAGMDLNMDGRQDMVITGTQGQPYYDGWYVQVLLQRSDGSFTDATNAVMPAADRFGGTPGTSTGTPWGMWVKPMDFNADGFQDFAIEFNGAITPTQPLVWLNDGTGHFTTIHAGDITSEMWRLGTAHWYPTEDGFSLVHSQGYDANGNMILVGMTATAPYTETPDSGMARTGTAGNDRLRGSEATADTLAGNAGIDTAVYFGNEDEFNYSASSVARIGAAADVDTLSGIERIEFRDLSVALDLGGNAGSVARVLASVFGPTAVGNEVYAGIGLELVDGGMSYEALMGFALQVALGPQASNEAVVNLLYTNVVGAAPSQTELAYYARLIDDGFFTQASLGTMAGNTDLIVDRVIATGLIQVGLEYV